MRRVIVWFAENGVAANLLMALLVLTGLLTLLGIGFLGIEGIKQEVFPEFSSDLIRVSVPYPGAAPEEVEEGVVVRVEEAIQDLDGIKKIRSTASEGLGTVSVELLQGAGVRKLLDEVKSRVDAIDTFPEEADEPVIEEVLIRRHVLEVAISGDADERTLKLLGERVRDDMISLPGITQVELLGTRPYEISVEVSETALRRYGLTFREVADAVRRSSLDLPGGSVEADGGEILLRAEGQAYRGRQFEELPLLALPDGTRLTVGDVAKVVDGFADTDRWARFDGRPAVLLQVFRVGDQNAVRVAETVREYLRDARRRLPEGIELTVWQDLTRVLRSRQDLLLRNGLAGFVLVVIVLSLFLKLRLAAWVSAGIPVSFLGAIALMPTFGVSINLISLFAFIVVLGIVVDDAIIVGESIYARYQQGEERLRAAVEGAHRVLVPVVFAVMTSVAAFVPLLNVAGDTGKIMRVIPLIVIPTLLLSLVESLLILPNHLSHLRHERDGLCRNRIGRAWQRVQDRVARLLDLAVARAYRPALERAIEWRYLTLAGCLALLFMAAALVRGGWINFTFFPPVEADNAAALLTMPQGTPAAVTAEMVRRLERTALDLERELEAVGGGDVIRHVLATIGEQPFRSAQTRGAGNVAATFAGSHLGEANVELAPSEERDISSGEIVDLWRARAGAIPDAVELTFTSSLFSTGDAIDVELSGPDTGRLREVAALLKQELRRYPGVRDIRDSFRAGKRELELRITPEAEAAGLTLADLARQVRQAFYGEEAQRVQRGRDDVKVMVRFPESRRRSLGDLEEMRIRTPGGVEIPFVTAARVTPTRGPAAIHRTDRRRVIDVVADVDLEKGTPRRILADLRADTLPRVLRDYPEVRYTFEGQQQQQRETMGGLMRGFLIALIVIYALLAVPFRSYLQPLIVMSAIPFGLIGAIGGHLLMGMNLTILSMFGIVALAGVVVNDSLVMVDFINRAHRAGAPIERAIREAGAVRFRPILLTSLTTFAGLTPLLLERSLQAQFLIPMAVSLAFGVLFATFITLVLVPALYVILDDLGRAFRGRAREAAVQGGARP
ncbi:MAG: efflux RND transporter permease subunit [Acidobacteriota bacterium]